MNLLFVCDPLSSFHTEKDSTFTMMREAQRRGYRIWACTPRELYWQSGERVSANLHAISLTGHALDWYSSVAHEVRALADMDAVLMRKDPPFDSEYFYATHLLSQAEREGAKVFNRPQSLREHPEKLALMEFAEFASPTLVSRNPQDIRAFHAEHQDIILKPLDGMGGMGIFRVKADGLNLGSVIETLNRDGSTSVMVQKFLPAIAQGDKRVLVINGQAVPFALARIPQGGEVRGNLAAGGSGVPQPLSDRDRWICSQVRESVRERGLLFVGLDVIGDYLTEINVTSPTCVRELNKAYNLDIAGDLMRSIESRLAERQP